MNITNNNYISKCIAEETGLTSGQVRATIVLLDDGATVPFIARYRKEKTGSLDEVIITTIRDRTGQIRELQKRKETILDSLNERNLLSEELKSAIRNAGTLSALEDIYLPFRPKRRTRATIAKEKGLEPLARRIFEQGTDAIPTEEFINREKDVSSAEDALAGARDIIAEWINEDTEARSAMRVLYAEKGKIRAKVVKGKEIEGGGYRDYFDRKEAISAAPSHRVLAMMRAEKESILSLHISPDKAEAIRILNRKFVMGNNAASEQVTQAAGNSFTRLLGPAMEREFHHTMKEQADRTAIRVFAENLRNLLLAPPLGERRVLAIDPGFRTGCKVVCLNRQGDLLHNTTIYPHPPEERTSEAGDTILRLCSQYKIEAIAIGNGTAGKETEKFIRKLRLPEEIPVVMVNESGASVYSASKCARDEFPDHDITVRGAVSIGRRLMDSLAELVKIDPESIGVGQYQHDVDQKALKQSLDDVVSSVVNLVGVDVNTASRELLTYVSGLTPRIADNIVKYREKNGPFSIKKELLKVPGLGPKTFEQAAGFLRIRAGDYSLDASAVHPEQYAVVEAMAAQLNCSVAFLIGNETLINRINLNQFISETTGLPTLKDIATELAKPDRDPRDVFENHIFAEGIESIDDIESGMTLPAIITNVTEFGAFADIGIHQDGLIHISELSHRFVSHPGDVVRVNQRIRVSVLGVDRERNRISLSIKRA